MAYNTYGLHVIGIIGPRQSANILLNSLCGATFSSQESHSKILDLNQSSWAELRTFFDRLNGTLYIHLEMSIPPKEFLKRTDLEALEDTSQSQSIRIDWQKKQAEKLQKALLLFLTCNAIFWCHEAQDLKFLLDQLAILQKAKEACVQETKSRTQPGEGSKPSKSWCPQLMVAFANPNWRIDMQRGTSIQGKSLVQVVSKAHDFNKLFLLDDNSVFSIPTSHEYHMAVMTHALEDLSQPVQPPLPVQEAYNLIRRAFAAKISTKSIKASKDWSLWHERLKRKTGLLQNISGDKKGVSEEVQKSKGKSLPVKSIESDCLTFQVLSHEICQKALSKAKQVYSQNLPPKYGLVKHKEALSTALQVFNKEARGPGKIESQTSLEKACEEIWMEGRQSCGVLSLTGNPCKLSPHTTPKQSESKISQISSSRGNQNEEPDETQDILPDSAHCSGIGFNIVDASGFFRSKIDDPFSIQEINQRQSRSHSLFQSFDMTVSFTKKNETGSYHMPNSASLSVFPANKLPELCQKFEVGFNAIQTMYMPAYEREPLDSNVKSEEETSMNSSALDLEFPPLLAALEPNPTEVHDTASSRKSLKDEREEKYALEIKTGWPGLEWTSHSMPDASERGGRRGRRGRDLARGRRGRGRKFAIPEAFPIREKQMHFSAGFEYETLQGRRFFMGEHFGNISPYSLSTNLSKDIPILLDVPASKGYLKIRQGAFSSQRRSTDPSNSELSETGEKAQLMRIWVLPPEGPIRFVVKPRILFKYLDTEICWEGSKSVPLQNGNLNNFSLPVLYGCPTSWLKSDDSKNLQLQTACDCDGNTCLAGLLVNENRSVHGVLKALSIVPQ